MNEDRGHARRGRKIRFGPVLLVCAALCGVRADPAPAPSAERIEKHLLTIQNHITNAQMRVRTGGAAGMARDGEAAADPPSSLAEQCCRTNLNEIGSNLRDVTQIVDQLDVRFARERNAEALDSLKASRGWLSLMSQGLASFRLAHTPERATQALQGLVRPFNELRASLREVETCCLPPAAPPAKSAKPTAPAR